MIKEKSADIKKRRTKRKAEQRVCIVDDHPILRQGLAALINQEMGMKVCCESKDMKEALQCIGVHHPDIAIIDIALGQKSGLRLIEELSGKYPGMPTMVLSMHDESLYAERSLRAGARGYIMKKEPPERIIVALKKILEGDIYVSESLSVKLLNKLRGRHPGDYSSPIDQLSNRELEVFELLGQGMKTREIAKKLSLSVKTIETYVDHIKKKMNFRDSRHLFMHAIQWVMREPSE